jgi:thiamine biosynthesis lipoprotein
VIVTAAAFLVLSFSFGSASAAEYRTGQPLMGTILQITVVAGDAVKASTAAGAALKEVERWDDVLTIWREEGELAALNRAAGTGPIGVSGQLHRSLEQMLTLSSQTQGAFDPAIGPLIALWSGLEAPTRAAIDGAGPCRIGSVLTLTPSAATLLAGAALDPGAIGKGIAIDAAVNVLRASGVSAALLDFGGSSQTALGAPPDSPAGWPIAIAGIEEGQVRGVVTLRDESLSTSRTRPPQAEDGRIIDPRTRLAVSESRLATVRTKTAAAADAWSTALVVLGREGIETARRRGIEVFFEDSTGVVETGEFARVPK